jgi:hypothetical protein
VSLAWLAVRMGIPRPFGARTPEIAISRSISWMPDSPGAFRHRRHAQRLTHASFSGHRRHIQEWAWCASPTKEYAGLPYLSVHAAFMSTPSPGMKYGGRVQCHE